MRKISVPINIELLDEKSIFPYIESVKRCKAERVFLIGLDPIYHASSMLYTHPEKVKFALGEFKKVVKEVGFWVSTLGHGAALNFMSDCTDSRFYTPMEGINGEISGQGYCPLDPDFRRDLGKGVETLASFGPDLIMLDDDFRIHSRSYYMGCFCERHLKAYYDRIGETVPRDRLEKLIWSGGENKYRSAYMHLMSDTLYDLAKELRAHIDSVSPEIRFGCCTCLESWDTNGMDILALQKAFAGNTKPFTRVCGAPYWDRNIIKQVETTRLEFMWCKESGVEVMSEGDTYPRPRINYPSKPLELFDLLLIANNEDDQLLNYIYEYNHPLTYEDGYEKRYIRNEKLREEVAELFRGKTPVGAEVFQEMHIVEKMDFPENPPANIHNEIIRFYQVHSDKLFSENSIPTAFDRQGYPVFIAGENAKYIDSDRLDTGAVLDAKAAAILEKRGIDVGLISSEPVTPAGEYFENEHDTVNSLGSNGFYSLKCREKSEILGRFVPECGISAYRYENASGQRFLVLGYDAYLSNPSSDYFCSYYRQKQLIDSLEWLGRKPLPAVSMKNPCLYILASKGEGKMAVAVANIFLDDALAPEIRLDKTYSSIRFVNCNGTLKGNIVTLEDMTPYGFAAFEVS